MGKRLRQHRNPFTLQSLVPRDEPLELPGGRHIEIELGCGDGLFIVERARRRPDGLFYGIDIRDELLDVGRRVIAQLALKNVRLEPANLIVDAAGLFAPARVSRFFINFPDPYFKRRQRNRRWFDAETLDLLVRALQDGGELIYQSDVWDPAIEALGLLELHLELENACGAFTFSRERLVEQHTSRERACEQEGRKIWRMRFVKRSSASAAPRTDG